MHFQSTAGLGFQGKGATLFLGATLGWPFDLIWLGNAGHSVSHDQAPLRGQLFAGKAMALERGFGDEAEVFVESFHRVEPLIDGKPWQNKGQMLN